MWDLQSISLSRHSEGDSLTTVYLFATSLKHWLSWRLLPGGWATCTQATGGANTCSSTATTSTGTTGGRPYHRSSPSAACATCSGTRGAASPPRSLPPTPPLLPPPLPPQRAPAEGEQRAPPALGPPPALAPPPPLTPRQASTPLRGPPRSGELGSDRLPRVSRLE